MLFNSAAFLAFFAIVLTLYWVLGRARLQNVMLLGASLFFYGWGGWWYLSLILVCAATVYVAAIVIESQPRFARVALISSCVIALGILGTFKYFDFFLTSFDGPFAWMGLSADGVTLRLALPIGISFFTFQSVGYVVDVYRGDVGAERDPITLALFVTFFPQLVAGPIERATHLLPQLKRRRSFAEADLASGTYLVLQGYVKKTVIADNLKPVVDAIFALDSPSGPVVAVGVVAFAFQIYGDFSGYTDIARGISRLMGFDLLLNFRRPYVSANPAEFWRRWHITLSTWFRDYLYIPLGGNRLGNRRTDVNLMTTMTVSGLWHGADWNFVAWGAYHGVLLVGHRHVARDREKSRRLAARVAAISATFVAVTYGWLLFRATGTSQIASFTRSLLTDWSYTALGGLVLADVLPYIVLAVVVDVMESVFAPDGSIASLHWSAAPALSLFLLAIMALSTTGSDFIYFAF